MPTPKKKEETPNPGVQDPNAKPEDQEDPDNPDAEQPDKEKPEEEESDPNATALDDPLLASLREDLKDDLKIIKPVAEEPETPEEKDKPAEPDKETKDEGKAADPGDGKKPEVDPEKADKPKRKKKSELVEEPPAPAPAPPTPAPEPPKAVEPEKSKADPDADYVAGLSEDQREELAEARKAEQLFPDRYKGREKKLVQWYRDLDATARRLQEADPNRTFDENDQDFTKFLKTKPAIAAVDNKKVQRAIIEEDVTAKVKEEQEKKFSAIEQRTKAIELKPHIDSVEKQFREGLTKALDDEVGEVIKTKGWDEARKEFQLETEIYEQTVNDASAYARAYTEMANGVRSFDQKNPMDEWILGFINRQGDLFEAKGGRARVQNGRTFLPRAKYAQVLRSNPAEAGRYWTFSDQQIVEMIALNAKSEAKNRIKATQENLERLGFKREKKGVSADPGKETNQPKEEPKPINPPGPGPKPAKGAAKTKADPAPKGDDIDVVQTLGLRDS